MSRGDVLRSRCCSVTSKRRVRARLTGRGSGYGSSVLAGASAEDAGDETVTKNDRMRSCILQHDSSTEARE